MVMSAHPTVYYMQAEVLIPAAISMTLCELATATHHSTPLECVSFSLDSVLYQQPPNPRLQGECVE